MIDDAAIREAFGVIAGEAHPPERIRASLAVRTRRHRQRRLVLRVAGAGAAVAAAGIGVRAFTSQPDPVPFPDVAGGPGGGWRTVPLLFRPTWLPPGYGQSALVMVVTGDDVPVVSRDWRRPAPQGTPQGTERVSPLVELMVGWHDSLEPNRPQGRTGTADIGGATAGVVEADGGVYVTWQPAGAPQLLVSAVGEDGDDLRNVALRMARSVRPDERRVPVGPRFGWLPEDLAGRPWQLHLGYDGQDWRQDVVMGDELMLLMGPHLHRPVDREGGVPVPVRGAEQAWQPPSGGQLLLTLPDGVDVFVQRAAPTGDPMPEMVHVVEEFDFGPWPDMSWVGSR